MTTKLTQRQAAILDFVRAELEQVGRSPTIREIRDACGISSTSVVDYNVGKMEGLGVLTREPEISRSIRPVKAAEPEMELLFSISKIGDNPNLEVLGGLVVAGVNGRPGKVYFQADIEEAT